MNDNIVKLVFKTVMAGSGFEKMNAQTSELMKKMGKMSQGVQIMGQAFGNLGGIVGRSLGMLMQGGIWGAAATVATTAIGKAVDIFQKWKTAAEDAKLAAKGLSREFLTLEHAHAGYLKRIASFSKRREEADRAEKEAIEKKRKAIEAYFEKQKKSEEFAVACAAAEHQISQERLKQGLMSDNEIVRLRTKVKLMLEEAKARVKAGEEQVRLRAKNGDENGMMLAKKSLELALVQQKNVVAEAKKMVDEYKKAKELAEEKTEEEMRRLRRAEAVREAQAAAEAKVEKRKGEVRKQFAEAVRKIEAEIAAKRKEAADWDERANRARGVGFGDWDRGERNLERQKRTEDGRREKRANAVDAEIERLEKTNPRTRTEWQRNRLSKLKQWKEYQGENPVNGQVSALEKRQKEMSEKLTKIITQFDQFLTKTKEMMTL